PLLIGGATTSRVHTAVKIAPVYSGAVVHVNDASKSVPVSGSLLSKDLKSGFLNELKIEYDRLREQNKNAQSQKKFISLEEARKNKFPVNWSQAKIHTPKKPGTTVFKNFDLSEIVRYIDWTPFFHSWELKGSYPKILSDPERGIEAKKLFDDAQKMLEQIISENWLEARAVVGIYPANSNLNDDIEVLDETGNIKCLFHTIRQQTKKPAGQYNVALSDFIKPTTEKTGTDYLGVFALSAGFGIDEHVKRFEANHDDYNAILLKALADRLAEAFAELMHEKVRKEIWGYDANEKLSNQELINEKYIGIRPAPGYPAQPDHTEKETIWKLLDVENQIGMTLTESLAMIPTAAVSGLYFANNASHYFGVGKINKDQVEDYAKRKQKANEVMERWLGTVLAY
ncbi:MAG: vitamin B12 dependent-methionine synthase activation domain-containing protein, partial [Bacteroidia bacterium]